MKKILICSGFVMLVGGIGTACAQSKPGGDASNQNVPIVMKDFVNPWDINEPMPQDPLTPTPSHFYNTFTPDPTPPPPTPTPKPTPKPTPSPKPSSKKA